MKRALVGVALVALLASGCGEPPPAAPPKPKLKTSTSKETFKLGGETARWVTVDGEKCLYVESDLNNGDYSGMVTCSEGFDPVGKPSFSVLTQYKSVHEAKVRKVKIGGVDCLQSRHDSYGSASIVSFSCE